MFSWIPLFAQFTYTEVELRTVFRKSLETYSENLYLKRNAHADSIAIAGLNESLKAQKKATDKAQEATDKAVGVGQTWQAEATLKGTELTQAKKEILKQRRLKWLAIGGGVVLSIGTAIIATKFADD